MNHDKRDALLLFKKRNRVLVVGMIVSVVGMCAMDIQEKKTYQIAFKHRTGNGDAQLLLMAKCAPILLLENAKKGDGSQVLLALEKKIDVDVKDRYGWTPLMLALQGGHDDVARLLLEHKADPNSASVFGDTPLFCAVQAGREHMVLQLLQKKSRVDAVNCRKDTALWLAVKKGCISISKLLLEYKASVNDANREGETPLSWAVKWRNKELVTLLLACKAHVNARNSEGITPYQRAFNQDDTDIIRMLVLAGADASSKVRCHVNEKAMIDVQAQELLMHAARRGDEQRVLSALKNGASVNSKDERGKAPLAHAVEGEHTILIPLLLAWNAYIDTQDNDGWTPLISAASSRNFFMVKILLDGKATVNAISHWGETPLIRAAHKKSKDIIMQLVLAGAGCLDDDLIDREYGPFNKPAVGMKEWILQVQKIKDEMGEQDWSSADIMTFDSMLTYLPIKVRKIIIDYAAFAVVDNEEINRIVQQQIERVCAERCVLKPALSWSQQLARLYVKFSWYLRWFRIKYSTKSKVEAAM